MKDRTLRDLTIFFSILVLIVVRWNYEEVQWMGCVACAGILVALFILYDDLKAQYAFHSKFIRIRGLFILTLFVIVTVLTLGIIGVITFPAKIADEFTLITLLISLPERIYMNLVAEYLHVEKYRE